MENLIFDRTQLDLFNDTEKGNYNYTDLNRVEEWCEYVANRLNEYNYFVDIEVKTNWTILDFPTNADMERIRSNVEKMKKAYYSFKEVPDTLNKIDILLDKMIAEFHKCGTFNSGGMEGLI